MRIVAVTEFKHGDLYDALKSLGWSQAELARRSKVTPQMIGRILNLRQRPSKDMANRIQVAFSEGGHYLDILETWPELFSGFQETPIVEHIRDVDFGKMIGHSPTPLLAIEKDERDEAIRQIIKTLTPIQQEVIESRIFKRETLEEIGNRRGVTREWVRKIEEKAIRNMQHPERRKIVEDFRDVGSSESRETV